MQIIPAIDLIDGKCVRLTHGNYDQKTVYAEDPVEMALSFQDAGLTRLHLVDLDGARAGRVVNWKVLTDITRNTKMVVDFGGGIKAEEDLQKVWDSGATLATIGSLAVKNETLFQKWIDTYGAEKFFLGADVRDRKIAVSGWLEQTQVDIIEFLTSYYKKGLTQVFCTDISKDGALEGPSTALYKDIIHNLPNIKLTASGGVSSLEDLHMLQAVGCTAAIVGKAIYEGRISLKELSNFEKKPVKL